MNSCLNQTFIKEKLDFSFKIIKLFPRSTKRGKPFPNEIFGNNEKYSPQGDGHTWRSFTHCHFLSSNEIIHNLWHLMCRQMSSNVIWCHFMSNDVILWHLIYHFEHILHTTPTLQDCITFWPLTYLLTYLQF